MTSLELNKPSTTNELYLERLDAFTEKTLADIRTFSTRESIPYDQVGNTLPFLSRSSALSFDHSGSASRRRAAFPVPLR
jgi:hypothetical protein